MTSNDWRMQAACRNEDPELWFPRGTEGPSAVQIEEAKAVCRRCPVLNQCQWAMETRQPFGVWGGLSEKERTKILRRRGVRLPVADEDEEPRPVRTFQSLYDERTVLLRDGHLVWTGAVPVHCDGVYYTPTQIAFRVGRGRAPVGKVSRTCVKEGCVLPAHLTDQDERDERRAASAQRPVTYSPSGRALAPCGTRSAYQRHIKNKEPIDAACRKANTEAHNRLVRTGTTKALAS